MENQRKKSEITAIQEIHDRRVNETEEGCKQCLEPYLIRILQGRSIMTPEQFVQMSSICSVGDNVQNKLERRLNRRANVTIQHECLAFR